MIRGARGFLTLPLVGRVARRSAGEGERGGEASKSVIPGRREAASPESIRRSVEDYGFRVRGLTPAPRNDGNYFRRAVATFFLSISLIAAPAFAASNREPAPEGSIAAAPPQYTRFSAAELTRGFIALAFGSDLRIGAKPRGIRRFDHPIRARVYPGGSVDRTAAMRAIVEEYARAVPALDLSLAQGAQSADIEVRLIDEKDFRSALEDAFGAKVTRDFVARTDPQCMTSVKSAAEGDIVRSVSFIIVDKGDEVFFDCAYHELLHAFGLSNHDQRNPWTTLNQKRMVGYLTVYDRALLTLLYDHRVTPGMTVDQARAVLPEAIKDLGPVAAPR